VNSISIPILFYFVQMHSKILAFEGDIPFKKNKREHRSRVPIPVFSCSFDTSLFVHSWNAHVAKTTSLPLGKETKQKKKMKETEAMSALCFKKLQEAESDSFFLLRVQRCSPGSCAHVQASTKKVWGGFLFVFLHVLLAPVVLFWLFGHCFRALCSFLLLLLLLLPVNGSYSCSCCS